MHASYPVLARFGEIAVYRVSHGASGWGPSIFTYLLTHGKTWSVVDCGWPGKPGIQVWDNAIRELGLRWDNLEKILVTHSHADHLGQAQTMSERSGSPVSIHADALAEARYYKQIGPEMYGELTQFLVRAGYRQSDNIALPPNPYVSYDQIPLPSHVEYLAPGTAIVVGDCALEPLTTPGHAHGHVCLVDSERRFVFAGDMALPDVITSVVFMPGTTANPLGEYLESLTRLEECGAELIIPAHGEPMTKPIRRFDAIRAHHARQLDLIRDRLVLGESTAAELAAHQTFHGRRFQDFSSMMQVYYLGVLMAYLQLLVAEGTVSSVIVPERDCQCFALV